MKKINYKSISFNILESLMVFIVGIVVIKCPIENMILVTAVFVYVRERIGDAKHYKNPIKCMIWSLILFEFLFAISTINILMGLGITILSAIIMSRGGDYVIFEYNNDENKKKYKEMKKYINTYKDDKLIKEFEESLKILDNTYNERFKVKLYETYKMYFLENATFKEIRNKLNINDNHGITDALDMIFISFNTFMIKTEKFEEIRGKEELKT